MSRTDIIQLLKFCGRFGMKALWYNYYYPRNIEYPLCFNKLKLEKGMKILDIGSGNSIFPIYMAYRDCFVYATDIDGVVNRLNEIVEKSRFKYLVNQGRLRIEIQDSRDLSYPDDFFDRVTAISTLEHIPEDGDIKSIKEIARVLKKGGTAFVSIEAHPKFIEVYAAHDSMYCGYQYAEIFDNEIVPTLRHYINNYNKFKNKIYARNYDEFSNNKKKAFTLNFVRYYNKETIFNRLINPSRLSLEEIGYYADTSWSCRRFFDRFSCSKYFSFLKPFLSNLFFKKLDVEEDLGKLRIFSEELSNSIAYLVLKNN